MEIKWSNFKKIQSRVYLDTYETERKYHAEKIIKASIAMGNIIMTPSPLKAFFRDIGIKIKSLTKKGKQSFYPGYSGIRLGEGLHNHPIERSHIFRYYFPAISLRKIKIKQLMICYKRTLD